MFLAVRISWRVACGGGWNVGLFGSIVAPIAWN